MENSLSVPTATSFRNVPAKLLEVNRKAINSYASAPTGKSQFHPPHRLCNRQGDRRCRSQHAKRVCGGRKWKASPHQAASVNMGLAVDVDKGDGTRSLVVPVLRDADTMSFAGFLAAYEEIIESSNSKLTVDDFQGANITLTNPGTIGTVQSVPRLMPGQGVIVELATLLPGRVRRRRPNKPLVVGNKVVTVTSTYDHRIIQGAESGLFEACSRVASRRAQLLCRYFPRP